MRRLLKGTKKTTRRETGTMIDEYVKEIAEGKQISDGPMTERG